MFVKKSGIFFEKNIVLDKKKLSIILCVCKIFPIFDPFFEAP